jgi:DNA-binding NarL/FixJ family response regulator
MQTGIVIYEDNDQLRESLSTMITLSPDLLLLGGFGNVLQVEQQVGELRPDVILMDIDMPGLNGIEAVKIIRRTYPAALVLMLTVFDDNGHVYDAVVAGASGYLLKKHISDRLLTAIREVLAGEVPMSPGLARMVLLRLQQAPGGAGAPGGFSVPGGAAVPDYGLTPREKEILGSLALGNSYKMIASSFSLSIDTVRTHIKRIYEKLQVHSQIEAVNKANQERLI